MPFQKGNKLGGKPKSLGLVKTLAKQQTEKAINTLIECLDSEDDRIRIAAANALLDRAWGKPQQSTSLEVPQGTNIMFAVMRNGDEGNTHKAISTPTGVIGHSGD